MPQISTDDEVYRVNQMWLGPPEWTVPFRARYIAWGLGIGLSLAVFTLARMWFDMSFFTVAWSVLIAVMLTRWLGTKITYERGVTSVLAMFAREVTAPREQRRGRGGAAAPTGVRVQHDRPRQPSKE